MNTCKYEQNSELVKLKTITINKIKNNQKSKESLLTKLIKEDTYKLDNYVDYINDYNLEETTAVEVKNIIENKCSECPDIPNFPPMNTPPDNNTRLAYLNLVAHRSLGNNLSSLV